MAIIHQLDKRSGITYVYESESHWDPEKKQSRSKRHLIGKLDPVTGNIIPTDGRCKKDNSLPPAEKNNLLQNSPADSRLYTWLETHFSDEDQEIFTMIKLPPDSDEELNEQEKFALSALRKVMLLYQIVDEKGSRYSQDTSSMFSEEDLTVLKALDFSRLPLPIRAKAADFLWQEKKLPEKARIAVDSYLSLFRLWFSLEDWVESMEVMYRIICITSRLNDRKKRTDALDLFLSILPDSSEDQSFLAIHILNVMISRKHGDPDYYLAYLQQILQDSESTFHRKECALALKAQCLKWVKKSNDTNSSLESAAFYESEAHKIAAQDFQSLSRKEQCIKTAIHYLNMPDVTQTQKERRITLEQELASIRKSRLQYMPSMEMQFDVSDLHQRLLKTFEHLTFQQAVVRLCQFVKFRNTEQLKNALRNRTQNMPFTSLAAYTDIIDHNGQVVGHLPNPDFSNPEKDPSLMHMHLLRQCYFMAKIDGSVILSPIINLIKDRYDFEEKDMDFLLQNNPIIPSGRKDIFAFGIWLGLKGRYYEALHILAPQMENLFRNLASELGGWTSYIDKRELTMQKTLEQIFCLPEFKGSDLEEYSLTFESLMISSVGGNIRNKIAHGIMNEDSSQAGAAIYFICAVIAYLALTSKQIYQIYQSFDESSIGYSPE